MNLIPIQLLIIGLVSSSSNHLFFIYPIVLVEFAAKDIVPIETVIAADFITVGLSVCALDFTTQNKLDVKKALLKQIKNPAFIGLILGLIIYRNGQIYKFLSENSSSFLRYSMYHDIHLHWV